MGRVMPPLHTDIADAIAHELEEYSFGDDYNHAPAALQCVAERIAKIFQKSDPTFDPVPFLKLCGTNDTQ